MSGGPSIADRAPTRREPRRRVLQFGSGLLLRGLIDPILAETAGSGAVTIVQSTGRARADRLNGQRGLYTLLTRGRAGGERVDEARVIDVAAAAVSAADDWRAVLDAVRRTPPEVIVSNTTEAGLQLDDADAGLGDADHPPRSFPAKLTAVLRELHAGRPAEPPVVLPCELIEDAGQKLRGLCVESARRASAGAGFVGWLERRVAFCSTLVDRICTAPADPDAERARLGYADDMLTVAEPFAMWAIEQTGPAADALAWLGRHPSVTITPHLQPVRDRKVRILNGSHTAIVPLALLAGFETVRETVEDARFAGLLTRLLDEEIVPHVRAEGAGDFASAVLDRFANPFIRHELRDITAQHTAKVGARLAPTIADHLAATGEAPRRVCLGLAAFLELCSKAPERVRDDRAAWVARLVRDGPTARDAARAYLRHAAPTLEGAAVDAAADRIGEGLARLRADGPAAAAHACSA